MEAIIDQVRSLFHILRDLAEDMHGLGQSSAGLRGVMETLASKGPQTVPQVARARPVSRQLIQMLVNELMRRGLVTRTDNPAHRRSKIVELTAAGRTAHRDMRKREERFLLRLPVSIGPQDLKTTLAVLRELHRAFNSPIWREAIREGRVARAE